MTAWLTALALASSYHADAPDPSRELETLETRYFAIHYPVTDRRRREIGAAPVARVLASRADDLLEEMVAVMGGVRPIGRVHVLVVDDADEANAYTLPHWDWIVLSAHPGVQVHRTRGWSDAPVESLAHELGHLIAHKASAAMPERLNYGVGLGGSAEGSAGGLGLDLEFDHNRPYAWSEGVAEWLAEQVGVVFWSTERAALLRATVREDRLLTWAELQVATDKDPGDAERAYQLGYAFARWLAEGYGQSVHARIAAHQSRHGASGWSRSLKAVTGSSGPALYQAFIDDLREDTSRQLDVVTSRGLAEGEEVVAYRPPWQGGTLWSRDAWAARLPRDQEEARESTGSWRLCPQLRDGWLLEGRVGAVVASRVDEGSLVGLAGAWPASDLPKERLWLPARFGGGFVHGPDGAWVVGPEKARARWPVSDGRDLDQLWWVDLSGEGFARDGEARRRMTAVPGTSRAMAVAATADGSRLAFLRFTGGGQELVVGPADGSAWDVVDRWGPEAFARGLSFSPDGEALVTSQIRANQVDLWVVDLASRTWTPLTDDGWSEQDPWWTEEGIWFVADPEGVQDVFLWQSGGVTRITSERSGAWCPSITEGGQLLYSRPTAHGVKAVAMPRWRMDGGDASAAFGLEPDLVEAASVRQPVAVEGWEARPYRAARSLLPPSAGPFLRVDVSGAQVSPSVGAFATARDAAERVELDLWGLVGDDWAAEARVAWRGLWPELGVWGTAAEDQWHEPFRPRTLQRGAVFARRQVSGAVDVEVELSAGRLRTLEELHSLRAQAVMGVETLGRGLDDEGVDLQIGVMGARSRVAEGLSWGRAFTVGEARWSTGDLRALSDGPPRLELRWAMAIGPTGIPSEEWLAAGGETPGVLRNTVLEPSWALPGYAPYALRGERLAVAGLAWAVPVGPRWRAGGRGLTLRRAELLAGADGAVVGPVAQGAVDVRLGARLATILRDGRFDSQLLVAWPLMDVVPGPSPVPTTVDFRPGPRWMVGLGTGW